jgi:4-hydroxy-4-methyl-2-oxoglutarate aldolase
MKIPDRSDDPVIQRFKDVPTGLITDAFLRLGLSGWMDGVLPLASGSRISGRARTLAWGPVRRSGKLAASIYALMSQISPGEVLVMGAGGTHDNLLGDNIATFAHRAGIAGIITDSNTRDRNGMRKLGLPVFSRGAAVRPPIEVEPRDFDVAISCGGAQVRPGDIIIGDDDGVIVIPADRANDVLYQIEEIAEIEEGISKVIKSGGSVREIEQQVARKRDIRPLPQLQLIAEREEALYAALATNDAAAFDDLFSDDVTYVHSTSIAETKAENIAGQRHGVHRHGPTTTVNRRTRILGDVAVTHGVIDMIDTAHGDPFSIRLRQTLVWVREDGVWRLLVRQATRIPG